MKIIEVSQNSPEWFVARLGIPSASNFDRIVKRDGSPSKQREEYLFQLAGERAYGASEESFQSNAMQRGIELEPEARKFYELTTGSKVQQVGFCVTEEPPIFGASPDGLIGEDGGLEIKCPELKTQIAYMLTDRISGKYYQQVQGSLLVTGRKWWDLMSYFSGLRPVSIRIYPDLEFHKLLKAELEKFCIELEETAKKII